MSQDGRDEIWNASFNTLYTAYFQELLADTVVARWQWLDETTKVLVAATASGSAVSGWALWSNAGFKYVWLGIAGVSALLAIIHTALAVPNRIKDHGDLRRSFAGLCNELETFRYRMQIDTQFSVQEFTKEFVELRRRFGEATQHLRNDILVTRRLLRNCQAQLNERLADQIGRL